MGPDAALELAADVKSVFAFPRENSLAIVRFVLDRIKERALLNGERLNFPGLGTFDRRFVDHKKKVWNSRGDGGETAPQFVLRFIPSKRARVRAVELEVGEDEALGDTGDYPMGYEK